MYNAIMEKYLYYRYAQWGYLEEGGMTSILPPKKKVYKFLSNGTFLQLVTIALILIAITLTLIQGF